MRPDLVQRWPDVQAVGVECVSLLEAKGVIEPHLGARAALVRHWWADRHGAMMTPPLHDIVRGLASMARLAGPLERRANPLSESFAGLWRIRARWKAELVEALVEAGVEALEDVFGEVAREVADEVRGERRR